MKFCSKCGRELFDEAIICPGCGCYAPPPPPRAGAQARKEASTYTYQEAYGYEEPTLYPPPPEYASEDSFGPFEYGAEPQVTADISPLKIVAKVFMIIGTVVSGLYIIPLAWCLPMTIAYCNMIKRKEPISVGFKVCTLLFVSLICGILLLCDNEDQKRGGI